MRRNKYNARKVALDGFVFDSKAEAARYGELRTLERCGALDGLQVHPRFMLLEAFDDATGEHHRPVFYEGDFAYTDNGQHIVEDVKGVETDVFKLKRKLFLARYPEYRLIVVRAR